MSAELEALGAPKDLELVKELRRMLDEEAEATG
jgi:hypothetical protein